MPASVQGGSSPLDADAPQLAYRALTLTGAYVDSPGGSARPPSSQLRTGSGTASIDALRRPTVR